MNAKITARTAGSRWGTWELSWLWWCTRWLRKTWFELFPLERRLNMSTKRFTAKQIANMRDRTDWARLRNMKDEDIDLSDIPELSEEFIRSMARIGSKVPISLRLDPDVVEWFKRG